jgi:hypothetical protein
MKNLALSIALTLTLFFIACGGNSNSLSGGTNPLVAQYVVSAPAGSSVAVQFGPDTNYGFTTSATAVPDGETSVTVLVAGMKQNSTYHMRAVTTLADGSQQQDGDRTFTTGTVSSDSVPASSVNSGTTAAPGVVLLGLNPGPGSSSPKFTIAALDPSGNMIWYYDYDHDLGIAQPIKLLANGHFLVVFYGGPGGAAGGTVREIDLAGNTINEFTVDDLNKSLTTAGQTWTAFAIHHDFVALPNGHLLLLVNSTKDFTDLVGFTGTQTVLGDSIVDLDENLKPVWVWSAFDHLDVNRHPMMFATPPPPAPPYHDWTHSNALLYSPDDGNILLSIRHQYWVIKIDYANGQGTGDVLWKLGYQGDFTLLNSTSPADWFYAQHFANIVSPNSTGDFRLAVFDNGDNRVLDSSGTTCGSAGAPACYSRPAVFEVNEADKTAQVVWSYSPIPPVYSFWGGAIQELPNNDMFVDFTTPSDNATGARILELTQDPSPQVVWKLDVNDQNSYRTIHLPSLYPGVQW